MSEPGTGSSERLRPLLRPRSIAIVGDSPRSSRGGSTHEQLIGRGYDGELFPVSSHHEVVRGLPAYPDVESLPIAPDLVIVATPAETVLGIVEACATRGVGAVSVLGGGFADAGEEGARLQDRVAAAAKAGAIALCGPNCYGVANLLDDVAASSAPLPPDLRPGPLALVLQSGALSHGIIDFAVRRGIGIGYVVTAGNEAGLDVADYLDALGDDSRVSSVAIYLEAVRRPRLLLETLERLTAAGTGVTILKSGRSEGGRRATAAHTGAVADDDRVWSALLESIGAVRVEDLGELAEAAALALSLPAACELAPFVMSLSGAATALVADLAADASLPLVQLGPETAHAVGVALPAGARIANPLDLTGYVADRPEAIAGVVTALDAGEERVLPVMVLNSPAAVSADDQALYCNAVDALATGSPAEGASVRLVATMLPGDIDSEILDRCRAHRIPVVSGMRQVVAILASRENARSGRDHWRRASRTATIRAGLPWADLLSGVAEWLARADTQIIGEGRAKQLLALAGIATPALLEVKSLPEALAAATSIGYPVALKVDDAAIPHKSKVGCLALDLHDADGVCAGFERLARNAATILGGRPVRAFVVEEQSRGGIDLFAGVSRDGELDPVLVVGIGGAIVESGIAVGAARLPLDEEAAERLLARSGLDRALRSAGGGAATAAVADVLNRLSRLAIALGSRLRALDVNPLRVLLNSEAAVVALDALVELERDDAKPGSGSD